MFNFMCRCSGVKDAQIDCKRLLLGVSVRMFLGDIGIRQSKNDPTSMWKGITQVIGSPNET